MSSFRVYWLHGGECELALKFRCNCEDSLGKIRESQDHQLDSENPTVRDEEGGYRKLTEVVLSAITCAFVISKSM